MVDVLLAELSAVHIFLAILGGAVIGAGASWILQSKMAKSNIRSAELQAKSLIQDAEHKADNIVKTAEIDAKEKAIKLREETEKEFDTVREELRKTERDLSKREGSLERETEAINERRRQTESLEKKLHEQQHDLDSKNQQLSQTLAEQRSQLLKLSHLSEEDAKKMVLERLEEDVAHEASALIERTVSQAKEEAEKTSRQLIINAIQRYAASQTAEMTVSTVDIPNDEMKGRVIGREGRNIRAFEKITGVDVIIDDTPGVVVISAFDPVRREIARISLAKLIQDGRIHPTRIEEVVEETTKEMDQHLYDIGKKVILETNLSGVNNKLLPYLGRLSYRTSYGQNVLRHSVEVAYLCQAMADELGLDGQLARRCGLLHDIGKAADHEEEGGHPAIGCDLAKRYGEKAEAVLNAIAGHHGDIPSTTPYTALVAAADAMSAARPGARRETMERYIKRLEALEEIATSFSGTKQAYAIQAGREVRVIVDPEEVDDASAWKIARDIAKKVQDELTYPGEVKVTLLREVRCVEFAR